MSNPTTTEDGLMHFWFGHFMDGMDLVTNIQVEHFPSITDHNIVTATTSFKVSKEVFKERNFLLESGRRFHQLDLGKAPWSEIKRRLGNIDWGEMEILAKTDVVTAHTHFVETVLPVLEELVPHKVTGKVFGKRRVDKERRRLWRRMGKLRKRLATTRSISRATSLHLSLQKVEKDLKFSYENQGWEEE